MGGPLFEKLMTRLNVVIKDKNKKRRRKNTNGYGVILTHFDRTVNYVWIIESNTQTVNGIRMMLFVLLIWFVFFPHSIDEFEKHVSQRRYPHLRSKQPFIIKWCFKSHSMRLQRGHAVFLWLPSLFAFSRSHLIYLGDIEMRAEAFANSLQAYMM